MEVKPLRPMRRPKPRNPYKGGPGMAEKHIALLVEEACNETS